MLQIFNSVFLSVVAVTIAVVVSFLAAFCFSRFKPKGTDFLMFLLLSIRMLPGPAVILPVYLMYAGFGWKDNHLWLVLFYAMFSIPFSVWILKGFLDGVSMRFDETGLVNGGSWFHVIFRVVMPQVKPGLIAAFIFNMIFVWNEYLFNFIIGGVSTQNIPYALAVGTYSDGGVNWTFIATHDDDLRDPADPVHLLLPEIPAGRDDLRHGAGRGLRVRASLSRARSNAF